MKKLKLTKICAVILCTAMLFTLLSTETFAVEVYNTKAGETPPSQFKNDSVFYDDSSYPCIAHNSRLFVPIELFVGLENIEYFSDDRGGVYLSLNTKVRYVSFDPNSNSGFSSVDGVVENIKTVVRQRTYVDIEYCASVLELRVEQATLNNRLVVRLSDSSVDTDFSDVLEEYVRRSDEEYMNPPLVIDPDDPATTNEIFPMVCHRISVSSINELLYGVAFRGVGFFLSSEELSDDPMLANYIKTGGGSIGIDLSAYTDELISEAMDELQKASELMMLGSRISTRLVLCGDNSEKISAALAEKGYVTVKANVKVAVNGKTEEKFDGVVNDLSNTEGKVYLLLNNNDDDVVQRLLTNEYDLRPLTVANS